MRFLAGLLPLAIVVSGCSDGAARKPAAPAETPVFLARYHFIGATAVAADTNSAKLTNIWALPSSRQLANATLDKVAGALRGVWRATAPTNAAEPAPELRALLDEMLQVESCAEWRGTSTGTVETLLAVRLPEDRAAAWNATLSRFATNWTGKPTTALTKSGGWKLKKPESPNLLQFTRAGEWVVVGIGDDNLTLFDAAVERATRQEIPVEGSRAGWLTVTADLPRLARRAAVDVPVRLGEIQFTAAGRDENVRFEGSIRYGSPLNLVLSEWQLPVSFINDPLTGFTAVRGLDALLTHKDWARDWGMTNVPNQAVSWAMAQVPFQVYWAMPLAGPGNLLAALEPKLNTLARNNLTPRSMAVVKYNATDASLRAEGLPFVSPFAVPIQEGGHGFLHGGLFPAFTNMNRAPQELFAAFQSRTNMVYYDWEITNDRLLALRQLSQLICLVTGRYQAAADGPGWTWAPEVALLLGETVTAVTLHSPTELRFTRRGHLGLTGAELTLLVRLLDARDFPRSPWEWLQRDPAAFATPQPRAKEPAAEKAP